MPHQVDDAIVHAMSGTELSAYERTSAPSSELSTKDCSRREAPTCYAIKYEQQNLWERFGKELNISNTA